MRALGDDGLEAAIRYDPENGNGDEEASAAIVERNEIAIALI